jgi:hypothetical protein
VGADVELTVALPPMLANGHRVLLHCMASVVRVERLREKGRIGVGAKIRSYQFLQEP